MNPLAKLAAWNICTLILLIVAWDQLSAGRWLAGLALAAAAGPLAIWSRSWLEIVRQHNPQ